MRPSASKFLNLPSNAEEREEDLLDVLTLSAKHETDECASQSVEGGPAAIGASARQLGLLLFIMTVDDFESAGTPVRGTEQAGLF